MTYETELSECQKEAHTIWDRIIQKSQESLYIAENKDESYFVSWCMMQKGYIDNNPAYAEVIKDYKEAIEDFTAVNPGKTIPFTPPAGVIELEKPPSTELGKKVEMIIYAPVLLIGVAIMVLWYFIIGKR